ncbi:unnamed protein product [Rangifer tarandus platyrhynchus]|uniref:Uncharacterized protein n=2 Tax=Rangifer tarandus platyrhynchus TaxID=3082113 RepID=A0ABN8YQU2_RANTA|nr:unnamed protein product [Rangifer tarandus platyrhynchus]CAI9696992.1 unnamed protein product [Rangifer tarandus platyrhynchus]
MGAGAITPKPAAAKLLRAPVSFREKPVPPASPSLLLWLQPPPSPRPHQGSSSDVLSFGSQRTKPKPSRPCSVCAGAETREKNMCSNPGSPCALAARPVLISLSP